MWKLELETFYFFFTTFEFQKLARQLFFGYILGRLVLNVKKQVKIVFELNEIL